MKTVSENAAFGGVQAVYSHASEACGCEMTFAVYLPPQADDGKVPVLWYLSGLTCTHENAMTKAGAQGWAADEGIAVISPTPRRVARGSPTTRPSTSGRGPGSTSTRRGKPWAPHFRMWHYVAHELPELVFSRAFRSTATGRGSPGIRWAGTGR